jgi:hypothetical protein
LNQALIKHRCNIFTERKAENPNHTFAGNDFSIHVYRQETVFALAMVIHHVIFSGFAAGKANPEICDNPSIRLLLIIVQAHSAGIRDIVSPNRRPHI